MVSSDAVDDLLRRAMGGGSSGMPDYTSAAKVFERAAKNSSGEVVDTQYMMVADALYWASGQQRPNFVSLMENLKRFQR